MDEKDALLKLEAYCASGEHCVNDVRIKLDKYDLSQDQSERIIEKLKENGFVDEQRYARAFVHDKLLFAKWGRLKISAMLWQKRLPQNIIDEALENIDDDDYIAVLKEVINSKKSAIKARSDYEYSVKLIKSVASRGFEIPLIKQFVKFEE
ncbi:MAG: RecX family transcriptional regulator [Bacteroidaceae bacterium]|nr:RecX family transcriptional regulator [Bacteroidaceae bacterium]